MEHYDVYSHILATSAWGMPDGCGSTKMTQMYNCARTVLGLKPHDPFQSLCMLVPWFPGELLIVDHPIARSQAELQALPDSPRDVVGDVRVCRFLRFHGGKVPEAQRGGKPGNLMVCYGKQPIYKMMF